MVAQFLTGRLDEELAQLHGIWAAKNATAGDGGGRGRAEDLAPAVRVPLPRLRRLESYFGRYEKELKPKLTTWFTGHAAQLGGTESCVFRTLSANYLDQSAVPAGTPTSRSWAARSPRASAITSTCSRR